MLKKVLSLLLSAVMLFSLAGCNLFEENLKKKSMQVVAKIDPIVEGSFSSEEKLIYRYQLINELNTNSSNYQEMDVETAVDQAINSLILGELVLIDINRMIKLGELEWFDGQKEYDDSDGDGKKDVDYKDENAVYAYVYQAIDSTLSSIMDEILTDRGEEIPTYSFAEEPSQTTYPIREDEVDKDIEIREQYSFLEKLSTNYARWPGFYGTDDDKSLNREAVRRFISLLKERAEDDFSIDARYAISKEDKQRCKDQWELFKKTDAETDEIINSKGVEYLYPQLYKNEYVKYYITRDAERQVKYTKLQASISDKVVVSDAEINEEYNVLYSTQSLNFKDATKYSTAIKDSEQTVIYHPDSKYFYVKHILLPFSDAQKAQLENYKQSLFKSNDKSAKAKIEAFRENLVNSIVVYPHKDGEDDINNPTTVDAVYKEIRSAMKTASSASVRDAERVFDDYIYLYNTDPGMFSSPKGYVVEHTLGAGETETYMQEFADVARDMYWNYNVGQMSDTYAITDYGVHIMYFCSKTSGTAANPEVYTVNDFLTPAMYERYYDVLHDKIEAARIEVEFTNWQVERLHYYSNVKEIFTKFEKTYSDIFES